MLKKVIIGMFVCSCITHSLYAAALTSSVEKKEGTVYVTIENPFLTLTFNPAQGGSCTRFFIKATGEEIIGNKKYAGMFKDHWAKYTWPSGLMWLPYKYEIMKADSSRIGIKLWITVPEIGGGKGNKSGKSSTPTSPDLIGIIVQKTIWLNADNDCVVVDYEIKNPTKKSKCAAPYIQHGCYMSGSRFNDIWYLPTTDGVKYNVQAEKVGGKSIIGVDFCNDPTAGWMAVHDNKTLNGMLFVFDYNYLQRTYTCGATAEWFNESVPIGPGQSFKTQYFVKPVDGFNNFVYGSDNIVVNINSDEAKDGIHVTQTIAAVKKKLSDVRIKFEVIGWKTKKKVFEKSIPVATIGFKPVCQEFLIPPTNLKEGLLIRAELNAKGVKEEYEYFYKGDKEEYDRKFSVIGKKGDIGGGKGDAYCIKQPRKKKTFLKPDFAKLKGPDPEKYKCLVGFGLYTNILKIDDALETWKYKGKYSPEFSWANCPPNAVEWFPGTYEELFTYNTIVLNNVNYRSIGDIGFEFICDFVEQGGSLIVTGGLYTFGNGEFEDTRFLEVLPVKLKGPFDLKYAGDGKAWDLHADKQHPILKNISFSENPKSFWQHSVIPKKGSEVILSAGGDPVIVTGTYGKGKVIAIMLTPMGDPKKEETPWWEWDGWFGMVRNMFDWLNK